MATYTARAIRSGAWWAITVDEVEGALSQARRLDQVEAMARDAIALMLGTDPDSFDITIIPEIPADLAREIHEMRVIRDAATTIAAMATMKAAQAVHRLQDEGFPLRDIGLALGVSYQRAHQIAALPMSSADVFGAFSEGVEPDRVAKAKTELGI